MMPRESPEPNASNSKAEFLCHFSEGVTASRPLNNAAYPHAVRDSCGWCEDFLDRSAKPKNNSQIWQEQ